MRTTITIPEALLRKARIVAAERRTTFSALVEDALRAALSEKPGRTREPFKLITFKGRGVFPGIDLDKTSALGELDDIAPSAIGRDSEGRIRATPQGRPGSG